MTKEVFLTSMAFLYKYFNYQLDEERGLMYWNLLKGMNDDQFKIACQNVVKEYIPTAAAPFPLIAHFLKYSGNSGKEEGFNAIANLKIAVMRIGPYNSVSFNDKALHFVVQSLGGWSSVCSMTDKDWSVNEGRMLETYKSAQFSNVNAPDHLAGIAEIADGYFTLALIPASGYMDRKEIRCKGEIPKELGFNSHQKAPEVLEFKDLFKM